MTDGPLNVRDDEHGDEYVANTETVASLSLPPQRIENLYRRYAITYRCKILRFATEVVMTRSKSFRKSFKRVNILRTGRIHEMYKVKK